MLLNREREARAVIDSLINEKEKKKKKEEKASDAKAITHHLSQAG